jgi:hypothetical protein
VAQGLATKTGPRTVIFAGLVLLAAAQVLFFRMPVVGSYAADLLPGFIIVALGLGLAFVGDVIASAIGVGPADAGLASGLINTSQQIGGAIGIAVTTTIAATRTTSLLRAGHSLHFALTSGFHDAFAVAAGLAVAGAVVAFALVRRAAAVPAAAQGEAVR